MRYASLLLISCFLLSTPQTSQAQILRDIIRKAGDRIEDRAEDMIADAIARAVTRQLQKKIDNYFDELARETFRQDSIDRVERGDTLVYRNYQEMMEGMLGSMNDNSKVLDQYDFDLILDVEIGSGKELDEARFFYSKEKAYYAVEQKENGDINTMLFDLENNVIVLFNEDKKGEKTAQALPWILNMNVYANSEDTDFYQPTNITKTGQQKTVAGYTCDEYKGETEQEQYTFYASPKLGEYWRNTMGQFMQRFTNTEYNQELQKIDGMIMESIATKKGKEKKQKKFKLKKKSDEEEIPADSDTYRVTKVNTEAFQLAKADYTFIGLQDN